MNTPPHEHKRNSVAPLVGAWIEIPDVFINSAFIAVAPLVGAWIEISMKVMCCESSTVAPLVGAWIEILRYLRLE